MRPGDLVQAQFPVCFYSTLTRVSKLLPDCYVPRGSVGIILEQSDNFYVKWLVDNKIGWSSLSCLGYV